MSFLQLISTIASIISIPLAVYYAHKTADATSDKARLEIIKTLSYKLSIECTLTHDDIVSVYRSKLREHKIKKAKFGIVDIVNDLKSDIMSNAFIDNQVRSQMLLNLSSIFSDESRPNVRENPCARIYRSLIVPTLFPIFVVLIIVNIVLFLLSVPDFIVLLYETIRVFNNYSIINISFYEIMRSWSSFFHFSGLYISIPCLVAWAVLIIAHNYFCSNSRHL